MVLGQPVTSEVRSSAENPWSPITLLLMELEQNVVQRVPREVCSVPSRWYGVFAPYDRLNLLDAVQKAYAIPAVVVLVRGERFPSLKIQVLPMTFRFSEFSLGAVRLLRASYLFPQCRATLCGVQQYDVARLDAPYFSAFLATHRLAFLITFRRGGLWDDSFDRFIWVTSSFQARAAVRDFRVIDTGMISDLFVRASADSSILEHLWLCHQSVS